MSQTNSSQCPSQTPAPFNEQFWNYQARAIQEALVLASLPAVLYGLFTILCIASMLALTQRSGKIQIPSAILSLTILALFISTTVYVVYMILSAQSTVLNYALYSGMTLWSLPTNESLQLPGPGLVKNYILSQYCASTAALTINILLGDAIVCWRACVLWPRSRLIKGICILLLLTTFAFGVVDTEFTCRPALKWTPDTHAIGSGSMYGGFSYGIAATALSFSTNFCATVLVGYRAWEARRRLRLYIVTGPVASQMEKVFALLLESGAAYCAFWAVVVIWQSGMYQKSIETHAGISTFWGVFGVIVSGALVPLIAIYPTIIIVLVALNRSHVKNGLASTSYTSSASSGTSMRLTTVRVDTTVTSHCDHQHQPTSEVLVIDQRQFEGSSVLTGDETKLEGIV